jgi:hypothetical protein
MSIVHLNRLQKAIESQVRKHISTAEILKEKPNISEEELENVVASQSYLLYCLKNLTGEPYNELKKYVTDGFKDNGIDGIYYSKANNELFICQAKWNKKAQCTIDKGEVLKFLEGVYDLLNLVFKNFNEKTRSLEKVIENAILSTNIKISVVLMHSGNNLSKDISDLVLEKISELNDTDEVIFYKEYSLVKAYSDLKEAVEGEPINAELDLINWGFTNEPYKSYYGTLNCGQIAEVLKSSNQRIYSKNIRAFIGINSTNSDIVATLIKEPENFFYLNNGIVLLCKEIKKSPYNSGKRELGKFTLVDLTIVNGAQTAGAISFAFTKQPEKVTEAFVFVKIISLENAPTNFDKHITIASNTQNKIEKRDFVSLDEQQNRLTNEFFLCGYKYHVKRDDKELKRDEQNYYFEEATVSLACFQNNVDYATYAKREIGKLWEDGAYQTLFNDKLNANVLVNLIKIHRETERYIRDLNVHERLICSHALYLISNLIFSKIDRSALLNPNFDATSYIQNNFKTDIRKYSHRVVQVYIELFPTNKFPLSIFKNFKYCRKIKDEVLQLEGVLKPGQTMSLFDFLEL